MKTKFNTADFSFAAILGTLLLAVMFMVAGFGINVHAVTYEPGFTTINGNILVMDSNKDKVEKKVIHVLTETKTTDGANTIATGYYYVNTNGYLDELPTNYAKIDCYDFADYKLGTKAQKLVKSGALTISNGKVSSKLTYYTGKYSADGSVYYKGDLYGNGTNTFYYDGSTYYAVTNGQKSSSPATGVIKGTFYNEPSNTYRNLPGTGYYVVNGKFATGLVDLNYYANGSFASSKNGWTKLSSKIYYFKNGTAVTGWKYLKSYGGGSKKYYYLFTEKGVLYTNLINYYGYNKFIKKDIKIFTNKTTHNTTFFVKVTFNKKSYWAPALTVICATARKKGDTPNGYYRLEKTSAKRWFIYTKTHGAAYRYYQWAVHIKGTPSLFHSSTYRTTKANTLRADLYNKLGTSCTTHCIRHQAKWAKLIYDIATKTNKKRRTYVQIVTSKVQGPFGHVSLKKISSGTKWDPTDPNKK